MSVVLPASGWQMIANVRRRSVSRARRASGFVLWELMSERSVLGISAEFTNLHIPKHQLGGSEYLMPLRTRPMAVWHLALPRGVARGETLVPKYKTDARVDPYIDISHIRGEPQQNSGESGRLLALGQSRCVRNRRAFRRDVYRAAPLTVGIFSPDRIALQVQRDGFSLRSRHRHLVGATHVRHFPIW